MIRARVDQAPAALREDTRRADIQGLRAVAVVMVIVFHASLSGAQSRAGGTFTGVDVFFVISGFVITGSLLRRDRGTVTASLADFYARRARRILPVLALTIVAVAALSVALLSPLGPQQQVARTGAAASVFAANVQLYEAGTSYFGVSSHSNALLHTWSLSVEEQFYLVFPILVLAVLGLARRSANGTAASTRAVLLAVLGLGVGVSFLVSLVVSRQNLPLAFYSSPTRAWEFGTGALLAVLVPVLVRIPSRVATALGLAGVGLLAAAVILITPETTFPGTAALLPVGGAALLIGAGAVSTRGAAALLATPPFVWLGDRSYSWYLWQWPALVFARALWPMATWELFVVGLLALAPASLTYRSVERRFRSDVRYNGRRALALVATCVAASLLACGGLALFARVASRSEAARSIVEDVVPLHADVRRGCADGRPLGESDDPECTWRADDPKGEIVLVGDSNAGQFTEPIVHAGNARGYDVTVATSASCPFVGVEVRAVALPPFDSDPTSLGCRAFVNESVTALVRMRPALVVVASSTTDYIDNAAFRLQDAVTGRTATSPEAKARLIATGLASVLARFERAAIPVVVVHVIPHIAAFFPQECPSIRLFLDPSSCTATASRAQATDERRAAVAAENEALRTAPSAVGLDFVDELCPRGECSAHRAGRWIYRDRNHLSVPGARALTASFARVIEERASAS